MRDLLEIYQNSETASRIAELHDLLQPTLAELAQALGYERAFVAVIDEQSGHVLGTVGVNPPEGLLETVSVEAEEPGPIVQSLRVGRPLRVDDALRDTRVSEVVRHYYAMHDLIAFAAVPLPPASGVLVVSKGAPISETEINELLPYAARLVASVAVRGEAKRLDEVRGQDPVEKEWLWWMISTTQDPIILTDQQNNILLHNIHAERLLIPRADDSPGKRRAIEINNALLSAALSGFILDQGAGLSRELTLVDPIEGAELLFELLCRPATNLRTGDQGLVSVLKNVTDLRRALQDFQRTLTELERSGEEMRVERDRLSLVLANVADPIVVTDPAGQVMLMNQPAERLLQSREALPADLSATIYRANDAKLTSFLSQLRLEAAEAMRGEIQLVDPETSETLTLNLTATEVRDELGQVTAIVSVLHDLTKVRELERRTLEQQLFESEKLAAVGRLAAATAHEINNPLEAIKNALYLLVTRTAADDPNRKFLEIASKETERVSNIIRQMLGFYRPAVAKAQTDVNRVLSEAITLVDRHMRQQHVRVKTDLEDRLPAIPASADQLKQVFLNLLLNARDAMPSGGTVQISTRLGRESDTEFLMDGRWVLVQFQDGGVGIPDEHLKRIFEPFFSTKSEQRGTGLGLWVSLGIVQQHGGQMKVRSRPGRGTTFTIALPTEDERE